MEIEIVKLQNSITQIRRKNGEKYFCLEDVMKELNAIKASAPMDSDEVFINGKVIYGPAMVGRNIIYTAFLEESAVNELLNKRQPENN